MSNRYRANVSRHINATHYLSVLYTENEIIIRFLVFAAAEARAIFFNKRLKNYTRRKILKKKTDVEDGTYPIYINKSWITIDYIYSKIKRRTEREEYLQLIFMYNNSPIRELSTLSIVMWIPISADSNFRVFTAACRCGSNCTLKENNILIKLKYHNTLYTYICIHLTYIFHKTLKIHNIIIDIICIMRILFRICQLSRLNKFHVHFEQMF